MTLLSFTHKYESWLNPMLGKLEKMKRKWSMLCFSPRIGSFSTFWQNKGNPPWAALLTSQIFGRNEPQKVKSNIKCETYLCGGVDTTELQFYVLRSWDVGFLPLHRGDEQNYRNYFESQLLWIVHLPCCEKFSFELLSTKKSHC